MITIALKRPGLIWEDNIKAISKKAYARTCECIHRPENGKTSGGTPEDRVVKCPVY